MTNTTRRHLRLVTVDGEQVAKPPRRTSAKRAKQEREGYLWMIEDHLENAQRAALALAYHLDLQGRYIQKLKSAEGFRWQDGDLAPSSLFGDVPFFQESELRVVPKPRKRKP